MALTRRELGWRPLALLMAERFVAGIAGGLVVAAVGPGWSSLRLGAARRGRREEQEEP